MPRKRTARRRDTPRRQVRRKVMDSSQAPETSFEDAFGHIDPYAEAEEESIEEPPIPVTNEDINDEDETNILQVLDNESATGGDTSNDHDVGFGDADYFNVKDVLELSDTVESNDVIKDLKDNCISRNSKSTYTCTLVSFILYI